MKRGGKFLVSTTIAALVAACVGDQGKLEIRSTPTKLVRGDQPVPYRIAEARGQLALGNVALALEAFRIAAREDPNSTAALAGIAACYDRMGRFDLSRRSYEAALALAPADTHLLAAFAASLQLQGRSAEALSVRREIAMRSVAPAASTETAQAATVVNEPASLPPARSVQVAAPAEPNLPARAFAAPPVELAVANPGRVALTAPTVELKLEVEAEDVPAAPVSVSASAPAPAPAPALAPAPAPEPELRSAAVGRSVTIKLPPARPAPAAPVAAAMPAQPVPVIPPPAPVAVAMPAPSAPVAPPPPAPLALPPSAPEAPVAVAAVDELAPLKPPSSPPPEPSFVAERGPRLERVSMGEISLVTVPRPEWRAPRLASNQYSTKVRFVPLREASTLPAKVRVLNAARVNRLAARTRSWLMARGWSRMGIGNAEATRSRSVILYPRGQRALAQNLANQFGFEIEERSNVSFVTMVLGRDAARIAKLRPAHA